jgi:hypothetical protein
MAKSTKRARPVSNAATIARVSVPITAANVWEFRNPEEVQASNRLVGGTISDTLESVTCVLAFLSDYHARNSGSELSRTVEDGLCSVIDWVLDAVEKQAKELEVDRG